MLKAYNHWSGCRVCVGILEGNFWQYKCSQSYDSLSNSTIYHPQGVHTLTHTPHTLTHTHTPVLAGEVAQQGYDERTVQQQPKMMMVELTVHVIRSLGDYWAIVRDCSEHIAVSHAVEVRERGSVGV